MAASPQSHHACIFSDCCWSHWRSCEKELNVWRCDITESEKHDQDELLEKWWNLVVGASYHFRKYPLMQCQSHMETKMRSQMQRLLAHLPQGY